jgi:hypothetical protein
LGTTGMSNVQVTGPQTCNLGCSRSINNWGPQVRLMYKLQGHKHVIWVVLGV